MLLLIYETNQLTLQHYLLVIQVISSIIWKRKISFLSYNFVPKLVLIAPLSRNELYYLIISQEGASG